MRRRAALTLATVAITLTLPLAAADAVGSCTAPTVKYTDTRFNAYLGHAVVATGKLCLRAGKLTATRTPKITFPSRMPVGGGESVELVEKPSLIYQHSLRHTYRFSVRNGPAYLPWARQTFDFDVHYYSDGRSRICFAGRACGPYS